MKQFMIAAALFFITAGAVHAQHRATDKAATDADTQQKLICPVTGEDADPEVTYVHEGQTYAFCCEGCISRFKKEPAKYIKNSSKKEFEPCDHPEGEGDHTGHAHETSAPTEGNGKAVINAGKDLSAKIVNTICPVMNEEVDAKVTTVTYKGKVYGFCCKSCIKKFANDPEKYLKKS